MRVNQLKLVLPEELSQFSIGQCIAPRMDRPYQGRDEMTRNLPTCQFFAQRARLLADNMRLIAVAIEVPQHLEHGPLHAAHDRQ